MKFSIFDNGKSAKSGVECTAEIFDQRTSCPSITATQNGIVQALKDGDEESYKKLKCTLPAVTWQAYFPDGERKAFKAVPSGLFMLDFDHVDDKLQQLKEACLKNAEKCDIVLINYTASHKGLRLVAKCQPQHHNIQEAQRWLWENCGAKELGVPYDENCFDWARCDFRPHASYVIYMDYKGIFVDEPKATFSLVCEDNGQYRFPEPNKGKEPLNENENESEKTNKPKLDITEYKGVPLKDIAFEWLNMNGGIPQPGTRNASLYKLARSMRYICDFDADTIVKVIPHCGLGTEEVNIIAMNAVKAVRGKDIPQDIEDAVEQCQINRMIDGDVGDDDEAIELTDTSKVPPLPPIFQQWYDCAPDDFKVPCVVIQLPVLGTLGSKLRAEYFDGNLHSPSFQVSLEAPQASGKSFMRNIVNYEMKNLKEQDQVSREKEREYQEKVKELKLLNVKINKSNKDEVLGQKPTPLIRYLPPTMSITEMLIRTQNAKGLHLFAMSEEIDTVHKAFKRGFSSFSDALRNAFDNAEYGQDYASDTSFSGIVNLYYNVLYSGTPKAMRRFYPDIEDGLVSRVFFCNLPDQFGKQFAKWRDFTPEEKQIVDINLVRLEEISIIGDDVQPEHVMKMNWLGTKMLEWVQAQQAMAVKMNDRTRDTFCRRAAVVGFRAGMLAFYLYGENNVPPIRRKVKEFAIWIANLMLKQHLIRFKCVEENKNVFPFKELYDKMPKQFTLKMLAKEALAMDTNTQPRQIAYRWKLVGKVRTDNKRSCIYTKTEEVNHETE